MVNEARTVEKIRRMEAKILSYLNALREGRNPLYAHTLTSLTADRLGKDITPNEELRYKQAIRDLRADIEKNLSKIDLSWKDYLADADSRGLKNDLLAAFELADAKKATKKAKKGAD